MKRKIAALAVIVIALSLAAYGTVAYFTATGTAHNVLTMGNIGIKLNDKTEVVENGETKLVEFTTEYPNGMPVMPATEASKIVSVENTGSAPAWVRVKIEKTVEPADAAVTRLDTKYVGLNYDTENWVDGKDGFWYYQKPLMPGKTTPNLFDKVTFSKDMGNDYMNCKFNIIVSAQAVQSDNNGIGDGQSVLDVAGWPESN